MSSGAFDEGGESLTTRLAVVCPMYSHRIYPSSRDPHLERGDGRPVAQFEGYGVAVPLETFWRPWRLRSSRLDTVMDNESAPAGASACTSVNEASCPGLSGQDLRLRALICPRARKGACRGKVEQSGVAQRRNHRPIEIDDKGLN